MPYFNKDDIYRQFAKEINQKADTTIENLKNEIEGIKDANYQRIHQELKATVNRSLEMELSELNSQYISQVNRLKTDYSKNLMKRRRELLDSIILEVREKLAEFINSEEYRVFIDGKIIKINNEICDNSIEFLVKKNDKVVIDAIKDNFKGDFKIKEITEIEIGGFSVICHDLGILIDETIDKKLKERELWFYEHSDLAASR